MTVNRTRQALSAQGVAHNDTSQSLHTKRQGPSGKSTPSLTPSLFTPLRSDPQNNPDQPYIKITGMEIPFAEISNSTLCITLRGTKTNGPCPTLPEFANSFTRATGKLEYALYDIKNQYECCPHFVSSIYGPNSNGPAPVQQPTQPRASTAGAAVPSTATSPPPASPAVPNPPSPSPSLPPASPDVPVPSPPASPAPVPAPATPSYSPSTYSPPSYAAPTYAPPSYGTNPVPAYGEQQQMVSHEQQQQQQRRLSRRLV